MLEGFNLARGGSLPRHAQIEAFFRDLIASGQLEPGQRIPSETEIARELSVSRMTVNAAMLALTREGLLRREQGLGTFVASSARVARHLMIVIPTGGVIKTERYDFYFGPLCHAIQAEADLRHHCVSLAYVPPGRYLRPERSWSVDGWVLIAPPDWSLVGLRVLNRAGASVVVLGAIWDEFAEVPMVDCDNSAGAVMAVRHLIDLCHERIALLYVGPDTSNTRDRISGYRQAMVGAGLALREGWEVNARPEGQPDCTPAALVNLLKGSPGDRPTAIFAANYHMALETLGLARELGLRVPEDLSVVGFDDPFAARLACPALTTIRQPLGAMGREAVELLEQLMCHEAVRTVRSLHAPELHIRASAIRLRGG